MAISKSSEISRTFDAVILAAGGGTRMRPLSYITSKPMLPICNKPMLEILIEHIVKIGITSLIIVVSPTNIIAIKEIIKRNPIFKEISISFAIQKERKGTAHALLQAKDHIKHDYFLMMAGDNYLPKESLYFIINEYFRMKSPVSVVLTKVSEEEILSLSTVLLDKNQNIIEIREKPSETEVLSLYAATSIYLFKKTFFEVLKRVPISKRGEYEIPSAFEILLKEKTIIKGIKTENWDHISNPEDLWRFNILGRTGNIIDPNIIIPTSSKVTDSVIGPNSKIGKNCIIHRSLLLPGTIIIDNSSFFNVILYTNNDNELEVYKISDKTLKSINKI